MIKNHKINELVKKAYSIGFTKAVYLEGLKIECESRLRAYCNPDGCQIYGNNWVCPPACGSIEECAEKIKRFNKGILLQSVSELSPPVEFDVYKELNREHNFRLREFLTMTNYAFQDILALTSGGCVFCDACTYPDPCIKPDIRMNSLSAYGVDVCKLCETADLEYSFRPDRVYFTAVVLAKWQGDANGF